MSAIYQPDLSLPARLKRKAVAAWRAKPARFESARGCVSFTFDDAPASAIRAGAPILERVGARATYYLSAGFTDTTTHFGEMHTPADITRVRNFGHEIACHTFSHGDGARTPTQETLADIDRNAAFFGAPLDHFAYPYGETRFSLKQALADRFATARGIVGGVNVGAIDLAQLKAQRLFGEDTWADVEHALRSARANGGWAIVFTHDVTDAPSPWGCTPALLERAVNVAASLDLEIAPVGEVYAKAVRR